MRKFFSTSSNPLIAESPLCSITNNNNIVIIVSKFQNNLWIYINGRQNVKNYHLKFKYNLINKNNLISGNK